MGAESVNEELRETKKLRKRCGQRGDLSSDDGNGVAPLPPTSQPTVLKETIEASVEASVEVAYKIDERILKKDVDDVERLRGILRSNAKAKPLFSGLDARQL